MAFDITNKVVRSPYEYIGGTERKEVADVTATTAAQDWTTARKFHRAFVRLSTYTAGDAGVVNVMQLEASDVSNFATNVDILDVRVLHKAADTANSTPTFTLAGSTGLVAGKQFARVKFTLGVNAAINADIIFEAA
jgi:hypothetical protein